MTLLLLAPIVALHLLLVSLATFGPLVGAWFDWTAAQGRGDGFRQAALTLARWSVAALVGGAALGALALGWRWASGDRAYLSALAIIPLSRWWFGLAEVAFYLVCMAAYVRLWRRDPRWRWTRRIVALAAASNLLVHFPPLFAILTVVSGRPWLWGQPLDRWGYWNLLVDGEVASRVVHVWIASAALTGVAVMLLALRSPAGSDAPQRGLLAAGARLALAAGLAQLPSGVWLTLQLSAEKREMLLGGDLLAGAAFLLSVTLALVLLHLLGALAWGEIDPRHVRRATIVALAVVLAMTATRWRLQQPDAQRPAAAAPLSPAARGRTLDASPPV